MPMKWRGRTVTRQVRMAIMRGVAAVAMDIRNDAIESITDGNKSGRVYQRRGIVHQASAPGEPPAADTGTLHNSITVELHPASLRATVNVSAEYAAALEFGTERMQPRPFMNPALQKNIKNLNRRIALEIRRVK